MAVTRLRQAPVTGLPDVLPDGERLLWQGKPCWRAFARTALFGDWVAVYFAAMMIWRAGSGLAAGAPLGEIVARVAALGVAGAAALAVIGLLAWVSVRATTYSITTKRVCLKIGVALIVIANAPFKKVAAANLRDRGWGRGDIALTIGVKDRFAYLILWPHARPWRFTRPEPMMRALPDAPEAARILGEALRAYQAEHGIDAPLEGADAEAAPGRGPQTAPPSAILAPAE